MMDSAAEQWFAQAEYDLGTVEVMIRGGRYFYAVFMAHLAVEKALKGLWQAKLQTMPAKTHNLRYLAERIGLSAPDETIEFLTALNDVSVPTRYPVDLDKLLAEYPESRARNPEEVS